MSLFTDILIVSAAVWLSLLILDVTDSICAKIDGKPFSGKIIGRDDQKKDE